MAGRLLNLSAVGLKVLKAPNPRDKVAWTLEAWETLQGVGELGPWPAMEHLFANEVAELKSMPETSLPGNPTSALRSLICTKGDWDMYIDSDAVAVSSIPEHPARPELPRLLAGAEIAPAPVD